MKEEEIIFYKYKLSINGENEAFDLVTTTPTATEVLKRLEGKVAGRKITEIKSTLSQSTYETRTESIDDEFVEPYGGCKVCGQFDSFFWACTGASEVAILACTKHKLFTIIQSSRYKGNKIDRELFWLTWDDITEHMDNQMNVVMADGVRYSG